MVVDRLAAATAQYSQQVQGKSPSTGAASKTSSSAQPKQTADDTTSFTSSTNTVQSLSKTALQTTPSRQVRVEALKQAVKSAQYQLDTAKIAQSLSDSEI